MAVPFPTSESSGERPAEFLRADAARNVHRIVEVAAGLLGDDPRAGMAEVAAAAGVSRATVYRHFANREALTDAIRRQARAQGEVAIVQCRLDEGSATEALRRLVDAWLILAERYSFPQLAAQMVLDPSPEHRAHQLRVVGEPLFALVERGQATGEFAAAASPEWVARVFGALVLTGTRAVRDDLLGREDATDVVFRTLLDGLKA